MPGIEKLIPHLAEHVVAVESLDRDSYGVGWVAYHYQKIREQLATSEEQASPLTRRTICCQRGDGHHDVRLQLGIARQRHRFSPAPPERRAEPCQETVEMIDRRGGVIVLELGYAVLLAKQDAEHARVAET